MRILLDTNVVVSALLFGGKPRTILESAIKHQHVVVTSPVLLSELADVLRKKFKFSKEKIAAVDRQMRKQARIVLPHMTIDILEDTADNRVLEAAVEGECEVIITGDKGLLALRQFHDIQIIDPDDFLKGF